MKRRIIISLCRYEGLETLEVFVGTFDWGEYCCLQFSQLLTASQRVGDVALPGPTDVGSFDASESVVTLGLPASHPIRVRKIDLMNHSSYEEWKCPVSVSLVRDEA
jgi:hypothetical protein